MIRKSENELSDLTVSCGERFGEEDKATAVGLAVVATCSPRLNKKTGEMCLIHLLNRASLFTELIAFPPSFTGDDKSLVPAVYKSSWYK
jgi:hypothetical protein